MFQSTARVAVLCVLAACSTTDAPAPVTRADTGQIVAADPSRADANGQCWAREVVPAAYDHVMGEVQVVQAVIDGDGTVLRAPVYRRGPVPRLIRPRSELRFRAPCPEQMAPDFAASVQRALAARGYFAGNVTGMFDAPTTAAIRKYQNERGLDSGLISLQTARDLGLVAVNLEESTG